MELTLAAKMLSFIKRSVTSPWFYVVLVAMSLAVGTFVYLRNDKAAAVEQATTVADTKASNDALATQAEINKRTQGVDQQTIILRERTATDYANARSAIQAAPQEERAAQVPPLLIDTLNSLDRLRAARDANPASIPAADLPKG